MLFPLVFWQDRHRWRRSVVRVERPNAEKIVPAVEKLKFNYFGHDSVVLHENEIRKQKGDFAFLIHRPTRDEFIGRLSSVMDASNFILIACVVDKVRLSRSEGANSKLRLMVKRILRKYKYPPDLQEGAVELVLQQAKAMGEAWLAA